MQIATASLAWETSNSSHSIQARLTLLAKALKACRDEGVDLLCLPAGYLKAQKNERIHTLVRKVISLARASAVALAVGMDLGTKPKKKKSKKRSDWLTRKQLRSSFAVCWSPGKKNPDLSRQRSVSSADQHLVPANICTRSQTLTVSGKKIEILTCGEIFNAHIRQSIISRSSTLDGVVNLGHRGVGFRVDLPMKSLAHMNLPIFCSAHVKRHGAMKRAYAAGGRRISSRGIDILLDNPVRLELKMWKL